MFENCFFIGQTLFEITKRQKSSFNLLSCLFSDNFTSWLIFSHHRTLQEEYHFGFFLSSNVGNKLSLASLIRLIEEDRVTSPLNLHTEFIATYITFSRCCLLAELHSTYPEKLYYFADNLPSLYDTHSFTFFISLARNIFSLRSSLVPTRRIGHLGPSYLTSLSHF